MDENPEAEGLTLLSELEVELAAALNSLGGKVPNAITDRYYVDVATYIHRAADGYLLLRGQDRVDASKLLIRPAIGGMIRIQALRKKPEIFYHIAYSERLEDHKWFRSAAVRAGMLYAKDDPDPPGWGEFEKAFQREFPEVPLNRSKLSLRDAAVIGGFEDYYDSHYRLYCQYAHAALRAMGGHSDDISDPEDTRTMILCAFAALGALTDVGAESPNAGSLHARVDDLSKSKPPSLKRGPVAGNPLAKIASAVAPPPLRRRRHLQSRQKYLAARFFEMAGSAIFNMPAVFNAIIQLPIVRYETPNQLPMLP
jgi:hypothetical protein